VQVVSLAPSQRVDWAERRVQLRPVILLHISLLLVVVANLGRIPVLDLGDREAPLLVGDLGVGAVLMASMLMAMQARSLRLDGVALMGLLFASIGGLSALSAVPRFGLTGFELVASLAYLARWLVYFGLYIVVINFVRYRDIAGLWATLETAILLFAAFGIVQSIFLPNFAQMVYPEQALQMDRQGHRLMSTVLEPNVAAAMLLTVLMVDVALLASGAKVAMWKAVLLLVALVLTLSRSGALGFIVGVLVILAARGLSKRLVRFGLVGLIGALASLPKLLEFAGQYGKLGLTDESAVSRLVAWQRAIAVFLEHPWFGIGFNTYGFVQEHRGFERAGGASYSVEGGLLFIAVMTGIIGLSVFVTMLWLVFRRSRAGWRAPNATAQERGLCIGAVAATVAVCVHSMFVNSIMVPFVMQPLFVVWGLVYVARTRMRAASDGGT
jgi:O-antigen ligase